MINYSISLITICFNSAATIKRTIDSVLSQQIPFLEYIIIDGGSTDGTVNIVKSYGKAVTIFVSEPDKGISDAFNKGISLASGKVIGLINSDDLLLPGAVNKVLSFFDDHPDVDVLHGDILLYDDNRFVKKLKPAGRWWYPWRLVLFNHPATYVKKSIYMKYGLYKRDYRYAMDDDLYLHWHNAKVNIGYLSEPFVRMQAGGVSGKYAFKVFAEKRRALISNGYPMLPATIQYLGRIGVQIIVIADKFLRRMGTSRRTGNG